MFSYEFLIRTWKFASSKSMFLAGLSYRCFVRGFRQFSSHLTKCHTCHGICTLSPLDAQCDSQKTRNTTRLKCCACHAKWRWTRPKCCACHENCSSSCENVASMAPATQNDFRYTTKHVWMSRSATPATRNEATRRLKPPKKTSSAELTIGTAWHGHTGIARTVVCQIHWGWPAVWWKNCFIVFIWHIMFTHETHKFPDDFFYHGKKHRFWWLKPLCLMVCWWLNHHHWLSVKPSILIIKPPFWFWW